MNDTSKSDVRWILFKNTTVDGIGNRFASERTEFTMSFVQFVRWVSVRESTAAWLRYNYMHTECDNSQCCAGRSCLWVAVAWLCAHVNDIQSKWHWSVDGSGNIYTIWLRFAIADQLIWRQCELNRRNVYHCRLHTDTCCMVILTVYVLRASFPFALAHLFNHTCVCMQMQAYQSTICGHF